MDSDVLHIASMLGRDPFSMGSHLLGAVLSVFATLVLVRRARKQGLQGRGVAVYGITMTLTFLASSLFHYVDPGSARLELFKKLDHAAIFLLVAGTGTAIYASLRTSWAERFIAALWVLVIFAIFVKLMFWPVRLWVSALIYMAVGWLGCLGLLVIARVNGWRPLRLFLLGGLVLTLGAVVFAMEWPVLWPGVFGSHDLFHILVLIGALLHFLFIYQHCTVPVTKQVWEVPEGLSWPIPLAGYFARGKDQG